ncbi:MAG: prepilin peptidase [Planctomycetota bacterium]
MYLIALGAATLASVFDLRSREIPDYIPATLVAASLVLLSLGSHPVSGSGVFWGLVAASLLAVPLFAVRAFGGGDAKLLMALGAALGLGAFLPFFVAMTVAGGVLGLRARARGEKEIAYAPAMLIGLLALAPLTWIA